VQCAPAALRPPFIDCRYRRPPARLPPMPYAAADAMPPPAPRQLPPPCQRGKRLRCVMLPIFAAAIRRAAASDMRACLPPALRALFSMLFHFRQFAVVLFSPLHERRRRVFAADFSSYAFISLAFAAIISPPLMPRRRRRVSHLFLLIDMLILLCCRRFVSYDIIFLFFAIFFAAFTLALRGAVRASEESVRCEVQCGSSRRRYSGAVRRAVMLQRQTLPTRATIVSFSLICL